MSNVIWKYNLQLISTPQSFHVPEDAELLTIGMQGANIVTWAMVDPDKRRTERWFQVFGTGDPAIPDGAQWVGTVQVGMFVWHVFDVTDAGSGG